MKEDEPKLALMTAVVKHCRGETWMTVPANIKDGELSRVQLTIACEHDKIAHQRSNPCHKSFFTRY